MIIIIIIIIIIVDNNNNNNKYRAFSTYNVQKHLKEYSVSMFVCESVCLCMHVCV